MSHSSTDRCESALKLIQIRCLEEQLEGLELTCEELEKENTDLVCQYNDLEKENKVKCEKLKSSIVLKQNNVWELYEQLDDLQLARWKRKALLEQDRRGKEEPPKLKEELQSKNENLAAALGTKQKQQISQKQKVPVEKKKLTKSTFNSRYTSLDHKLPQTVAFDGAAKPVKKPAVTKAKKKKLEEYKKKKLIVQQKGYFPFLLKTKQTLDQTRAALNDEREHLYSRMSDLKKDIIRLTQKRSALDKKSNKVRKEIRQLILERNEYWNKLQCPQNEADALREQFNKAYKKCPKLANKKEQLKAELLEETMRRRKLERGKQEAAIILRHILTDPEKSSEAQWKTQKLVKIMKSKVSPRKRL